MSFSILLVDDSLPMRSVLKKTFKAAGYSTSDFFEAANGQEALEVLKNNWIDIVLTDFTMPVMDGLKLLQEMKKDDLFREIPVVVITTEGNQKRVDSFFENGAAGYIKKPFTPEQVRDIIISIMGESDEGEDFDDSDEGLDF
ncbi:MAG: response regulator [Thermodesulfobacteriota bacterium]|nr:response regulator [Thermodesulfobacteriota bacterium]